MYGDDSKIFLITSLLDEIDFRDQRTTGHRDTQKIAVLQEEIYRSLEQQNFPSLFCQAFEGGSRQKNLQQGTKLPDETISNVCKTLKLSPIQTVAVAFSLAQSQYLDTTKFLKAKLPEIVPGISLTEVHGDILHGLAVMISSSEELSAPEISGFFMSAISTLPQLSTSLAPLGGSSIGSILNSDLDLTQALSVSRRQRMSVASILVDFGYKYSASLDTFRQVMREIGITLDEEQVAEIIVILLAKNREQGDLGESKIFSMLIDEQNASQWNLEFVGEVLSQDCRGLNWTQVAEKLDQPNLSIRNEADFQRLIRFYSRISGTPLPAAGLMGLWNNRSAQLALLTLAVNAPRTMVDFSALVTPEMRIPGEVPFPPNFSWMCLSLYSTLISLATSGLSMEISEALIFAATVYPEYVAVSLAQVQDPVSGVRAEVLRRTLPMFTGLPGSKPTSMAVMMKLQSVNPDLLVLLTRIALKRASTKQEMVDIDSRLKSLGTSIIRRVEEECLPEELLGYWCVKADKGEVNLEEKSIAILERNPQIARSIVNFAQHHAQFLRPSLSEGRLLSFESFAMMLRAVQVYPSIVSIDEIRALAAMMAQQQQQQQNQQQLILGIQPSPSHTLGDLTLETSELSITSRQEAASRPHNGPESDEVEEEANAYFQKIYTSDITIADVIQLLQQFKSSTNVREQEVFRCMIHNLFDEYRFFYKYPDKELLVTGRLFGTLIQHQLISSITLGIALRYVLEALRKDPEHTDSNEKMFRFGKISLEQFRPRLGEWPQYCSHLVQIPHLAKHCPDLYQDAQRAINNPLPQSNTSASPNMGSINGTLDTDHMLMGSDMGLGRGFDQRLDGPSTRMGLTPNRIMPVILDASPISSTTALSQQLGGMHFNAQESNMLPLSSDELMMLQSSNFTSSPALGGGVVVGGGSSLDFELDLNASGVPTNVKTSVDFDGLVPLQMQQSPLILPLAVSEEIEKEISQPRMTVIERMALVNVDVLNTVLPSENIRDQIHFIVNNIAKSNCEAKSLELRNLLTNDHFNWFANYLVVKRISTQPNLHPMYLTVLDAINSSSLSKVVLDSVYHNVTKLLQSPNITSSSSERSLLRNLGIWLGQMTLARNKPLFQRRVNLKELLFWGYGTGRLIAVCSFVARIIEGARDSKVFRPPNPWLMALLGVLREMYETEDLKMNIKFEVQVLCKNINIKIEDIQRTNQLTTIPLPVKDIRNPDFNVKVAPATAASLTQSPMLGASPTVSAMAMQNIQQGMSAMPLRAEEAGLEEASKQLQGGEVAGAAGSQEQTVIPNLAAYVTINPSLQFFTTNPAQRRLVSLAVDRAIREIIQPVVERSVTIASVTTKQLILKDFSTEPNEQQLRSGAHMMIANLAGSLALVTCKEPLRVSIGNHLRSLLQQVTSDQSLIEQIVQVCSNDNLELGCMLIEKASTEKAISAVDESLAVAIQARRKSRETNQAFVDTTSTKPGAKYPRELPDALKPNMGGLHPQQLLVYEGFQRARAMAVAAQQQQQQQQSAGSTTSPATGGMQGPGSQQMSTLPPSVASPNSLSMSQALESYQHVFTRVDMSLKTVMLQAQGRDISITHLAGDHEILALLRELVMITQRTQPAVRNETAMTFSENLFKRMVESVNVPDTLRLEVMVGILEALRDACGGAKKFAPDIVSWLGRYAAFNANDEVSKKMHRAVLILLLRAKLLRSQDVDLYFATYMDAGRNMVWVELALSFVKQCLAESLAATYEFANTFETVSKMRPANTGVRKQLQKWLTDLRTLAASKEEQKAASGTQGQPAGATAAVAAARDASVREHVTVLLERWLRVWTSTNDQVFGQYLQLMHQYGVLKTEEAADRFFRIATELCAEACLNSAQQTPEPQGGDSPAGALTYTVVDALSKLFLLLVRLADKEAGDMTVRVNLLSRILNAVARTLLEDHETKKTNKLPFDQRPYFRLLSSLAQDLGVPDVQQEPNQAMTPLLGAYSQVYLALQPSVVPGFAFAWLQLISHRCFMPQLLLLKGQKGWPYMHRLVIALLLFLQPFLKHAQLNDSIRRLYKGTLRVLLVLLHDFPEFLYDYYLSFCDVIPSTCVQLRNLILSAFPRSMRLPDPFTPNLKVDLLPEIAQSPRVLTDYMAALSERGIRPRLDSYIATKSPQDLPSLLPSALIIAAPAGSSTNTYNLPLITSLVVYVGAQAIVQLQSKIPLQNSPAMDIFKQLVTSFDSEGRYHLFNAMANQLRYPNSHTHYFSCVLLSLFAEADTEAVQEQITRVLLERLIVHRPHPWGLLITFIELIKNPRYAFWRRNFTKVAPELERVFESVARSCMGPTASATMLQQQLGQQTGGGGETKTANSVR